MKGAAWALEEFFFNGDIVSNLKLLTHSFLDTHLLSTFCGIVLMLGIGDMTFIKMSLGCM